MTSIYGREYYSLTTLQQTLNYAPICIAIVTVVSLFGWVLPFGLGGRYWFDGPKRTVDEAEDGQASQPVGGKLG